MESASLAFPALHKVGQQVPGHGALHLAVDVMPRLPRPCRAHRLVVPNLLLAMQSWQHSNVIEHSSPALDRRMPTPNWLCKGSETTVATCT